MTELRQRLMEIRECVSPRRINEAIHPTQNDAKKIISLLPATILARTETRNGGIKVDKRNRFLKDLQRLVERGFTLAQLLQMDEECIDNKGRIDESRMQKIIRGEYDD